MGKKYNTSAVTVRPIATGELAFLVEAWEGIKPSRKAAVTVRIARETERPANWRPKTDKIGRRPRIEAVVAEREVEEGPHECDFSISRWEDVIYHHSGWIDVTIARCECGSYNITPEDPEIHISEDDHAHQVWIIKKYRCNPVAYVSESYEGSSPFKKLDR
jgi:hypothetical protein